MLSLSAACHLCTLSAGPGAVSDGVIKGIATSYDLKSGPALGAAAVKGLYTSADSEGHTGTRFDGRDGLRVGDGFHDYIM